MFDIDKFISNIDSLLKKYYPYSVFIAGMIVFVSVTALCTYIGLHKEHTIELSLKACFSNIRGVYTIFGAAFITIYNLTNRYKEDSIEISIKVSIILAIINTIIFILIATLIFLGFSQTLYKSLMLVYVIFLASLKKVVTKGYINIFKKLKK